MKDYISGIKNKIAGVTQNPGAVFGMLYPYIIVVGIIIGIYYVQNLENISRQSVPPVLSDTTIVSDLQVKNAMDVPPINIMDVKNSTPELLAEGEKLYKTNCASCHGENGVGGGTASMGLNPAPRNFTSKDNWKNGTKLSNIYTTLQEGLPPSAMIAYEFLLPQQKFALAHFIRTSFIPNPAADSDGDLQALDATYNLSVGLQLPAQIPVKSASFLTIEENKSVNNRIDTVLSTINKYKTENGYSVFTKVVKNKKIAISFLTNNTGWKQNENNFVSVVINNVNQNGFNGFVFNLKNDEWNSLYSFMLKLI
ncbi:MAG: cytochrome c [Ignavibacteriales bacterium]|nr:cytochrome c [Ignavibacteriales bacterium]